MESSDKFEGYVEGGKYLVTDSNSTIYKNLSEIKFKHITNGAYCVVWYSSDGSQSTIWERKDSFESKYDFFERLPDEDVEVNSKEFYLNHCVRCSGNGMISDHNSTSGKVICPKCHGSGYVVHV